MWNVLLDPFPEEWNGYPIDSDFQTGIQISQCLGDDSLSETEQFYTAVGLLFPDADNMPGNQEAAEALIWFLKEYNHDNDTGEKSKVTILDFDVDQWRIYAAFLNQYHIDLNNAKLHWFAFMGLLINLNECAFNSVMNIRQKKITSDMSADQKRELGRLKKVFEIKPPEDDNLSPAEQQRVDDFMKHAKINREPNQSPGAD